MVVQLLNNVLNNVVDHIQVGHNVTPAPLYTG